MLTTVQVKLADPANPAPSVAVRVTDEVPPVVGVPEMVPVAGSTESPAGSPVADHVSVAPAWVSVAEDVSTLIGDPDVEDWAPGLATATVLTTVQVKLADPANPAPSVAVRVTDEVPAVVGVPVMAPEEPSTERPAGSPVAVKCSVAVGDESEAEAASGAMDVPDGPDCGPGEVTVTMLEMTQVNVVVPEEPADPSPSPPASRSLPWSACR